MAKGFGGRGMPGMGGVNMDMLRKAQKMQQEMQRMQEELQAREYTFAAGGGVVTAVVNGHRDLLRVEIDPQAVDPEDVEMLQDLVVAAVNGALAAAESDMQAGMQQLTGGLNLPF